MGCVRLYLFICSWNSPICSGFSGISISFSEVDVIAQEESDIDSSIRLMPDS